MNDQQLKAVHEAFKSDHDRQRGELLDRLRMLPAPKAAKPRRWIPAASSIAAALGIAAIGWYLASVGTGEVSWAQVSKQLQQVQTFTYHFSAHLRRADGSTYDDISRHWFRLPYQERTETDDSGTVWIANPTGYANALVSFETRGSPRVFVFQNILMGSTHARDDSAEWLSRLRDLGGPGVVKKGEEVLAGRRVIRFEEPATVFGPSEPPGVVTIWVDAATSLPVRLTTTATLFSQGKMEIHSVELDDMKFDQALADNLFAMPDLKGKTVSQTVIIHVAAGTQWPRNALKITTADGQSLASSADIRSPQLTVIHGNLHEKEFELIPEAAKRIDAFTRARAGQKLTVQLDQGEPQTLEVLGPITRIAVAVAQSQDQPTTSPTVGR